LDEEPAFISDNPYAIKMSPMRMIVDINHPANNFCDTTVPQSVFPYEFEIDYIRAWQMKQYCDSTISLCSFNPAIYDFAVYKFITLGGSSCSPTIPVNSNVNLRVTDGIILDKGFTVPLGAEFMAETTPCQEQDFFIPAFESASPPSEEFILRGKY
jgi:hypothetical protein